jgi:hypothetical protein
MQIMRCTKNEHENLSGTAADGRAIISAADPPYCLLIIIVHLIKCNNHNTCYLHPDGCMNTDVLERDDHGVGMLARLHMMVQNELACYAINTDG